MACGFVFGWSLTSKEEINKTSSSLGTASYQIYLTILEYCITVISQLKHILYIIDSIIKPVQRHLMFCYNMIIFLLGIVLLISCFKLFVLGSISVKSVGINSRKNHVLLINLGKVCVLITFSLPTPFCCYFFLLEP